MNSRVLLLNASWEPLRVLSLHRAVCLVVEGKAEIVEKGEGEMRSPSLTVDIPSVVRLKHYVKIPFGKKKLPISRNNVLARDSHRCGYCLGKATTVDHIVPKAKGGKHTWKNVTAACAPCNNKKSDKTLKQLGWVNRNDTYEPNTRLWLVIGIKDADRWEEWISPGINSVA